ncbi:peptidylprolyl isomerase [Sphingorhabdus sp. Alg239-R122]|uniref:peptidylprolyl isomerase n=1 Tax=Sphingorhabdus sp. Alg239-R122 TaxID=2305989 RepID=UPI0013D991DE|nr:peptidylprolyl isomerase [Sphingorhabdus sp. Alg239-R122]
MKRQLLSLATCVALIAFPVHAQDEDYDEYEEETVEGPSPEEVLAAVPAEHWLPIPVADLMVMRLADAADGSKREIVIQLLPARYSGGHVRNVRKLAAMGWWNDTGVYRVDRGFVTQFGSNPYGKMPPETLETVPESEYFNTALGQKRRTDMAGLEEMRTWSNTHQKTEIQPLMKIIYESYGAKVGFAAGWPVGLKGGKYYPITCRGALSPAHYDPPDTGSGSEISIITGEEARSLDTTFGYVGRVIDGLEHAINLPQGSPPGGFYDDASKNVPIKSIRMMVELPSAEHKHYEYLASYSPSLLQYIAAHGGYGNICTVDYPVRLKR